MTQLLRECDEERKLGASLRIAKREEHKIGSWVVVLLYNENGEIIAAELNSTRLSKPLLIARHEKARVRLPQRVKQFLRRHGFEIE